MQLHPPPPLEQIITLTLLGERTDLHYRDRDRMRHPSSECELRSELFLRTEKWQIGVVKAKCYHSMQQKNPIPELALLVDE